MATPVRSFEYTQYAPPKELPDDLWLEWAPGYPATAQDPPWSRINAVTGPGATEYHGLMELEYDRGVERAAQRIEPGTMMARIKDRDRVLDPLNRSSPLWPFVSTGVPIRVMALTGAEVIQLWRGSIKSVMPIWGGGSGPGVGFSAVDIKAVELLEQVAQPFLYPDWYATFIAALNPRGWWPLDDGSLSGSIVIPKLDNITAPTSRAVPSGVYTSGTSLLPWSSSARSLELVGQSTFGVQAPNTGTVGLPTPGLGAATDFSVAAVLRWSGVVAETSLSVFTFGSVSVQLNPDNSVTVSCYISELSQPSVTFTDVAINMPHHLIISVEYGNTMIVTLDGVWEETAITSMTSTPTLPYADANGNTYGGAAGVYNYFVIATDGTTPPPINLSNLNIDVEHVAWWAIPFTVSDQQDLFYAWLTPLDGDTTGSRINNILDVSALATSPRSIEIGTQVMGPIHWDGTRKSRSNSTYLDELSKAANTELGVGLVFTDRNGLVRYTAYGHEGYVWPALSSIIDLSDVTVAADDQTFCDDVRLGVSAPSTLTYEFISPNANLFGTVTYDNPTEFRTADAAALAAPLYTSRNATPGVAYARPVITKAEIRGGMRSWSQLLPMDVGDWVSVNLYPPTDQTAVTNPLLWGESGANGWGAAWSGSAPTVQVSKILKVHAQVDLQTREWVHEFYLFPISG